MNSRGCSQLVLIGVCLILVSCDPPQDASVSAPESVSVVNEYLNLPKSYDTPDRLFQLGRVLFYDKSLSANNSISCGSCHKQQFAFGDNVRFSKGFEGGLTLRNTMPLMDVKMGGLIRTSPNAPMLEGGLFWDGRSPSLQDAVSRPITNHIEMGMTDMAAVVNKLKKIPYYPELFAETFGKSRSVGAPEVQQALLFFVRALNSGTTRFQQYERGLVELTYSELLGRQLFIEKYDCASCHEDQLGVNTNRPLVYGGSVRTIVGFTNIGLPDGDDKGLYEFSRQAEYKGLFKIPNLNNVELTAPYMHDGSLATLEEVLDHYSESIQPHPNLDVRLRNPDKSPKRMNFSAEEKEAIIDFLKTFTDDTMASAGEFSNPFKQPH
jgi:cytochrome c peroxidase